MNKEDLKTQLLNSIDVIVDTVYKSNAIEIRRSKDNVIMYELTRNKIKTDEKTK